MSDDGVRTGALISRAIEQGADHVVSLVRHSARTFGATHNDLDNQLTNEGRETAHSLGFNLPKPLLIRAYTSPVQRCVETADIIMAGHVAGGGNISRNRILEGLGVFYILDHPRMWMGLDQSKDLATYMSDWAQGRISPAIMIPAPIAARLVAQVLIDKLSTPLDTPQLDLCITHDMTVHLLCDCLLNMSTDSPQVAFLDGLIAYQQNNDFWLESVYGTRQKLSLD